MIKISKYKRQEFFEDLAGAYAELKADAKAWNEEKKERRLYENTLLDGIAVSADFESDVNVYRKGQI